MNTIEIPHKPEGIQISSRRWALNVYALYFLAADSSPVRSEHEQRLAQYFDKSSKKKYITNAYRKDLIKAGLIFSRTFFYLRGVHRVTLIRLTEAGKQLCRSFGWQVCENEWERLIRLHSGDDQPHHTSAMVIFSLAARMRGWTVSILPKTDRPHFQPDLLLEKNGERFYVEVELGSRRWEKWQLYKRLQGYAVVCGKTYESTRTLIEECAEIGVSGRATTLDYLVQHRRDPAQPLFPISWNEKGGINGSDLELSDLPDEQG